MSDRDHTDRGEDTEGNMPLRRADADDPGDVADDAEGNTKVRPSGTGTADDPRASGKPGRDDINPERGRPRV